MLSKIIHISLKNKFIVLLGTAILIGFGIYSLSKIPIGAVPDITNNQIQVITTSRNLATQDMEQFITYPVELEMANVPGVTEIRSTTKFGLSVVTVVFEDAMGTYLPRQLLAEKIKSASEKIPKEFGTPEMGPITTGLGEIYQYILDVKPAFKNKYSTTELRTMQDWIVKRQLSGIKGVVEVNTWGGFLKQYEVAINTQKLNAMNITTNELFSALENNNTISGGAYIEKENQSYFIRGEGLIKSITDVENTLVKNVNGLPVLVKDVAKVQFGSANRFGAITSNGEGEKVMGQVIMLKDANSKEVISAVKERIKTIEKSLPEGVFINPVTDRSELIAKTTFTISENLLIGSLIVIFVVVLLLGNFRSGLVVASVIPLSLLFTLTMMYLFKIDANLMSLGAIDFGIIIDGAVIIIEFVSFKLIAKQQGFSNLNTSEKQIEKDNLVFGASSKMMKSAIFGQLIILIVFIPILSLTGVEGKMFKPMAIAFSFALIGAMILCLTYVPVIASIVLKAKAEKQGSFNKKLLGFFNRLYTPVLNFALSFKRVILAIAIVLFALTLWLFSTMGSEFVPTLDEGDFVIQPALKTGTSLSKTIEITTKIEQVLLDEFPEVKKVVSRIGAAELPTDPMSMEESDIIIVLKPKAEWTSAKTKDGLADLMEEKLMVLNGIAIEFTQPIEMRFNELITGVRADIAVKIFGDDLTILAKKAEEVNKYIQEVEGASDITVEKVVGLPQMNVQFNRSKIARYGLTISQVSDMLSMGFAGAIAGNIYEGEKQFDLVVRLEKDKRNSISDLQNLFIDTPNGLKVPLSELATITYKKGAAKISRDDTKRRIVVGINVRNRDLQSVVDDISAIIDEKLDLPTGYYVTYGGQFENLKSASKRLKIAVPVALLLIFILLYFAFKSVKEALIIYSAIPLAAVGGVMLLWLRDMPFSISAGVGFIALFGIAVLNGIVLIEEFKHLGKKEPDLDQNSLIKQASKSRLRAVLLTALAAALGFLPMAVSTGAGAEVQRPLATVVVGGLFTSTILTLIVLPVLYAMFTKRNFKLKTKRNTNVKAIVVLLCVLPFSLFSQEREYTLSDLTSTVKSTNLTLINAKSNIEQSKLFEKTAVDLDKTEFYFNYDQSNFVIDNEPLRVFGVSQDIKFPSYYKKLKESYALQTKQVTSELDIKSFMLEKEITHLYYDYLIANEQVRIVTKLDSLYGKFAYAAKRKFELGETNYLEKITAQSKQKQIANKLVVATKELELLKRKIKKVIQQKGDFKLQIIPLQKLELIDSISNPRMDWFKTNESIAIANTSVKKKTLLPDFNLEYAYATSPSLSNGFNAYQIGVKVPLFYGAKKNKIKMAKIQEEIAVNQTQNYALDYLNKKEQLLVVLQKYQSSLDYYEQEGKELYKALLKTAMSSFKHGEIDFFQYIQTLEHANSIQLDYLNSLQNYNDTVIEINYLY